MSAFASARFPDECPKQPFTVRYVWEGPKQDIPRPHKNYGGAENRKHTKAFITNEMASPDEVDFVLLVEWYKREIDRKNAEIDQLKAQNAGLIDLLASSPQPSAPAEAHAPSPAAA